MPVSVPCVFSDGRLAYVESLSEDLTLLTEALNTFDEDGWAAWHNLTYGIAEWSAHVRSHYGAEVAFRAELMMLLAHAAPYVKGWEFHRVMELYEPIEGFWRA